MTDDRATVTCPECGLDETFARLRTARERIADHRAETGHAAMWDLHSLDSGVERASDDAGVCGRPECTNRDSPLFRGGE